MIHTFINKGRAELKAPSGRAHGYRYEGSFLIRCLLLKLKSNSTYRHIQQAKLLPLPSSETIRKMLSSTQCRFGFNELALESIQQEMERIPEWESSPQKRWGSLMWDEISLKKDVSWHSKLLEWHGIADYGPDISTPVKEGIATHCLVLMFRPYLSNWVQPIACFATIHAASGELLHEIITKAIVLLHNHKAIVTNTVCDGCTSNKKAMDIFGVSGESSSDKCETISFTHPMDPNIAIYWMIDVPHLLKCTRNQLFRHLRVQVHFKNNSFEKFNNLHNFY